MDQPLLLKMWMLIVLNIIDIPSAKPKWAFSLQNVGVAHWWACEGVENPQIWGIKLTVSASKVKIQLALLRPRTRLSL